MLHDLTSSQQKLILYAELYLCLDGDMFALFGDHGG